VFLSQVKTPPKYLSTAVLWPHIFRSIRQIGPAENKECAAQELHAPIYNRGFGHRNNDPTARLRHLPGLGSISMLRLPLLQPNTCQDHKNNPWLRPLSCLDIIQTCTVGFINLLNTAEVGCHFKTHKTRLLQM